MTEPEKTFEEVLDEHPVSIQVNGQWQTFPNAKAAEEASYEAVSYTHLDVYKRQALRSLLLHRGQNRLRRHRQRILPMIAM